MPSSPSSSSSPGTRKISDLTPYRGGIPELNPWTLATYASPQHQEARDGTYMYHPPHGSVSPCLMCEAVEQRQRQRWPDGRILEEHIPPPDQRNIALRRY